MIVAALLLGILSGLVGALAAWSFGLGALLCLLAYSVGGMVGMSAVLALAALPGGAACRPARAPPGE